MEPKPTGIMQQFLIKHLFDLKFRNFVRIWISLHRLLQSCPCTFWLVMLVFLPLVYGSTFCTKILLKPNRLLKKLRHVLANVFFLIFTKSKEVNFEFFIKLIMLQMVLLQQGRFLAFFSAFCDFVQKFLWCFYLFYFCFYFEWRKWQLNDSNFYEIS